MCSSVLVVICTYAGLFISIWHTRRATPLAAVDMDFVLRFFFIVLTNLMCWAPVYVLRLLVLFKYPVPGELPLSSPRVQFISSSFKFIKNLLLLLFNRNGLGEVSVWVVVFVVPINAAVNPILYTFTTPKFRRLLAQLYCQRRASKRVTAVLLDRNCRHLVNADYNEASRPPLKRQLSAPAAIEMSQIISLQPNVESLKPLL